MTAKKTKHEQWLEFPQTQYAIDALQEADRQYQELFAANQQLVLTLAAVIHAYGELFGDGPVVKLSWKDYDAVEGLVLVDKLLDHGHRFSLEEKADGEED